MINLMEITTILGSVLGIFTPLGGLGVVLYQKQNKRLKEAEAALAEANVNKAKVESKADEWDIWKEQLEAERAHVKFKDERIDTLLKLNAEKENRYQESLKEYQQDLREAQKEIRDKTAQIRKYVEDIIKAESETNRVNNNLNEALDRITVLTAERDEERRKKEYYKRWRCEKSICSDPDGRIPPNSKLASEVFTSPE